MGKRKGELGFVDWVSSFNQGGRHNPKNPVTGKPYSPRLEQLPIIVVGRIRDYKTRYASPGGQYTSDFFSCFLGELLESQRDLLIEIQKKNAELMELTQLIRETERRLVQAGCGDAVETVLSSLEKKNYFDEDEFRTKL